MRITHLGHSALLIETDTARVLVDPGGFSQAEEIRALRDVDAVLVTHQHPDHADPALVAAVLAASPRALLHGEPQAVAALRATEDCTAAAKRMHDLAPGDELTIADLHVAGVGGEHAVIHPDIPRVGNTGLVLQPTGGGPCLGITGDSLQVLEEFLGIDALAFPVVAPWSKMHETIDFLRAVRPRLALPVHDAVASPEGRAIYMKQSTDLAPDGTEVRDWPETRSVNLTGEN